MTRPCASSPWATPWTSEFHRYPRPRNPHAHSSPSRVTSALTTDIIATRSASWPSLLCDIVARIEKIAHNDFPIPILPAPARLVPLPMPCFFDPLPSSDPIGPAERPREDMEAEKDADASPGSSQETNKENANPAAAAQEPAAAAAQPADPGTTTPPPPQPPSAAPGAAEVSPSQQRPELPPQIAAQLAEITSTLTKGFPSHPPHTIQRLAELVLRPRQHYRSLPSYLHAVDRVIQVASGAHIFPLPPAAPDPAAMAALANGVLGSARRPSSSSSAAATAAATAAAAASPVSLSSANSVHPGSDEALGGALLTPIPWLTRRAESVDGADAALSPEPDMMDGGSSDDGLSDTSGSGSGGAGSHQPHDAQHHGSGRPRQQQRLSTESTETIEGPNGVGHIETVSVSVNGTFSHHGAGAAMAAAMARAGASASSLPSVGGENQGVTQGELIREEQRHGVVPTNQADRRAANAASDEMDDVILHGVADGEAAEAKAKNGDGDEEEAPHLRGPEQIGLADTGLQAAGTSIPAPGESAPPFELDHLNVEAAVGRPRDGAPAPASDDSDSVTEGAPTPKREADGSAAGGGDQGEPPAKKVKGDQDAAAAVGDAAASDASAKQGGDASVDSDGDVLITDDAQPAT
ncbi:hypothetical protein RB598_005635 [Gaeumannomyces tritici]